MLGFVAALACLLPWSCRHQDATPPKAQAAASIAKTAAASISAITLSGEASARLGLRLETARIERVERWLELAGFVERAPDSVIVLRAPLAGELRARDSALPRAGTRVAAGQEILFLHPLLSPGERMQSDKLRLDLQLAHAQALGAAQTARAREQALQDAAARAEALHSKAAGSARASEEARSAQRVARAELDTAEALERKLREALISNPDGEPVPLSIRAPADAQVLDVAVSDRQSVEAGAVLLTLAREGSLWLRVPVQGAELEQVRTQEAALWSPLGTRGEPHSAPPIAAPPSANALAASVDCWYDLGQDGHGLRPGQRVGVQLKLRGELDVLVVPWSAVLFDAQGATWVYVAAGERTFERRRVEIERKVGDRAVIAAGLAPGSEVVAEAAAELFGVEFGAGK